jgi:choline-glycine betaine transporter
MIRISLVFVLRGVVFCTSFFCLIFLVIFGNNFKKQSMNPKEILWQLEKDIYQFNLEKNEDK